MATNSPNLTTNSPDITYLSPNFHSIAEINASLNQNYNRYPITCQLDFNGSGLFSKEVQQKFNEIANFYSINPCLPYFLDHNRSEESFSANNCLIECQLNGQKLLVLSAKNKIIGHSVDVTNSESPEDHVFSDGQTVSDPPFRYTTTNITDLFVDNDDNFRPIFELNFSKNEPKLQTISRNKIRFYGFKEELNSNKLDISLDLSQELNVETFRRSEDAMFESCSRNAMIGNYYLISYTCDNVIDLYDLKTNQIIRTLDEKYLDLKSDQQIGIKWNESNPKMFFYGEHERILYCDFRTRKPVLEVFTTEGNINHFEWEKFYRFLPSKLNDNQLFVATDCHIFLTDRRYPKKNLIQLYHMIPKTIIRSLKSLVVTNNETETEILVSSNFSRNCLMSFKSIPILTALSSLHYPLHSSVPKDSDIEFANASYRGIQLLDCPKGKGFSLALLTQFGDIFMQDFYWDTIEEQKAREADGKYRDRTCSSGVGSDIVEWDPKAIQYMKRMNEFLNEIKCQTIIKTNFKNICIDCKQRRVCKLDDNDNECQCRLLKSMCKKYDPYAMATDVDRDEDHIKTVYDNLLPKEIIEMKEIIENKHKFIENTDKFTKKILQPFDNFDDSQSEDDRPLGAWGGTRK